MIEGLPPVPTSGNQSTTDELADQARAFWILTVLIGRSDVWQVNIYQQMHTYTCTITLAPKIVYRAEQLRGLAGIGFPLKEIPQSAQVMSADEERRTITAHGDCLFDAVMLAQHEYDDRVRRLAERNKP
jgi:hypothetical protein